MTEKKRRGTTPAPTRHHTTMRLQVDLLDAIDKEANAVGFSRTQYIEQALAKHLRGLRNGHRIKLRSLL